MGMAVVCAVAAMPAAANPPSAPSTGAYGVSPTTVTVGPVPAVRAMSGPPFQCHPGLPFFCYSPQNMRDVYNIPSGPGSDGSGQTIILVVAFGSPFIADDLATFDGFLGLPDPPSFTTMGPNGTGDPNDPIVFNWIVETSIDVEWAHAIAPGANIVLAVARSDDAHAINKALARAVAKYPGAIVSQSFGADENFVKRGFIDDRASHRIYVAAAALGDTVLAATGDFGASNGGPSIVAVYPASDPLVTSVGGTEGNPWPNGLWTPTGYGAEQVWNETPFFGAAAGGAPSQIFPSPLYQSGLGYSKRTTPDVSYNASIAAGTITVLGGRLGVTGGTSVGPPQWAGIFAIANQQRAAAGKGPLGFANQVLYDIYNSSRYAADFHDVTVGDNIFDPSVGGFAAALGYDLATGIGTPNVANLLTDLVAAAGSPSAGKAPNVDCQNATLSGVYHNVNVKKGASCTLANATVTGDVQGDKATTLKIQGTTILGDLRAGNTSGGASSLCNSIIFGNARIENSSSSSPWSIGGATCAASPDVTGNTGNVFGKDLRFNGNASTANEVSNNTIADDLECNKNGGVTGSGNLVGDNARGQCASAPLPGSSF